MKNGFFKIFMLMAVLLLAGCSLKPEGLDVFYAPEAVEEELEEELEEEIDHMHASEPGREENETIVLRAASAEVEPLGEETVFEPAPRVYGPVTKSGDSKTLVLDNRSRNAASGEMILTLSEQSRILDSVSGFPVAYEDIIDGEFAYAYIGAEMTMSLPPIVHAQLVMVDVPEDYRVPDYVRVATLVTDAASCESVLTAMDGTVYALSPDCILSPYLTKNIVSLMDLSYGRDCLIWTAEENVAVRIMIFPEEEGQEES